MTYQLQIWGSAEHYFCRPKRFGVRGKVKIVSSYSMLTFASVPTVPLISRCEALPSYSCCS